MTEDEKFDYFHLGADLADDGSLPNDYRGMSGGGVWQVTLSQKNGSVTCPSFHVHQD